MATLLHRLGTTAYRRWPVFLAGWLVALIAVGALAATVAKPMSDSFSIPGIPSERAADLQAELFPESVDAFDQASVNVVVAAPEGRTLTEAPYADVVADLVADLQRLPQMAEGVPLVNPVDAQGEGQGGPLSPLSGDGRVGIVSFAFDVETVADVELATIDALVEVMEEHEADGLRVEANGAGSQAMSEIGATSELIGIAVALLVLLLTFGSLVAAGLPIITALVGVGLGIMGVTVMTAFTDIGSTTPILATMIGLAVGIDYTLFILARYRTEQEHTDDQQEAVGVAVGTAGTAVVFAGLTVIIALAALAVVGIPFLTAMGLAAAGTVLVAVLVALTLLPAILGLLKHRAFGGRVRRYAPAREADGRVLNNGVRWARLVGRRPVAVLVLGVLALGALAVPLKNLHLAFPTDSTASVETTQRQASDLMAEAFGPGREGPLVVVVDARDLGSAEERSAAFDRVASWAGGMDDVQSALVVATNEAGTGAQVLVTPASGPDETATEDLLAGLRDGQSRIEAETGTVTGVTGLTAITVDVSERLSDALPIYLAIVIGLAFLLLMIVFRSVLVPLTATLGFLLSVLATLGATVAVFQQGAFGLFEGQPIVSFMPIFLIGVVFGLAMDYQVFLVTRVREAHVHGMSMRDAVVDGFRNSARVVAAAAAIMTAVFAAFMLLDEPIIKSMGFALAIAVVFDAFVVRMALVPALLFLLGDRAWWLPGWLDRLLPVVDVEGENLERHYLRGDPDAELVEIEGLERTRS
ncbi:MMPL family transporter [Nocardioides sp. SYSU D00038]|uniref:MMPL family transporter n=1 Tax=Nocardioides sp. SYSU D00038 TaxID=2812554 RepID=UPI001968466A|nr:MMPL family transporter [Nocardioides sp. SYSU D00038]